MSAGTLVNVAAGRGCDVVPSSQDLALSECACCFWVFWLGRCTVVWVTIGCCLVIAGLCTSGWVWQAFCSALRASWFLMCSMYDLLPSSGSSAWWTASKQVRISSARVVCFGGVGVGAFGLHKALKADLCFQSR